MSRSAVGNARHAAIAAGLALIVAGCGGAIASSTVTSSPASIALASPSAATSVEPSLDAGAASPSDAPSDAPTPTPIDPCSLVTRTEANAVAGTKTLPPEAAGDPPERCVWATPTSGAIGQVELDVGDGAKKTYDIDNTVLKHTFKPVPGLGDEAYVEESAVFFRKGDTWAAITVVRLDDPKTWESKMIALAKTVAGRLP